MLEVTRDEFEQLVRQAINRLPARFVRALDNVAILVDEGWPPKPWLGLYHGIPKTRRGSGYTGVAPDTITIWMAPILRESRGRMGLVRLVRRVVWHEIGHHLGFDERRIRQLETKWERERKV